MRKRALLLSSVLAVAVLMGWWIRSSSSERASTGPTTTPVATAQQPRAPGTKRIQIGDDDSVAPAAKKPANRQGQAVFFASWGGKGAELGRERPTEGNPVGPMSMGVDSRGRVTVLDGVNGRLVRRGPDGTPESTIALDAVNPEDIAVASDGSVAVLDRFQDKAVSVYDESGTSQGKLPLAGAGVPDVGSITGVFIDGTNVYVEREHGPLIRIGNLSGAPAEPRTEIPGRPTRDGLSFISAGIIEALAGRVYVTSTERATETHRFTRELHLESLVHSIVLLDTDKAGTIYFAAEVETQSGAPSVVLHCLDPLSGEPVGSAVLPANTLPEESFRDYTVLDGGGVIQVLRSEQGVTYARYDCQ